MLILWNMNFIFFLKYIISWLLDFSLNREKPPSSVSLSRPTFSPPSTANLRLLPVKPIFNLFFFFRLSLLMGAEESESDRRSSVVVWVFLSMGKNSDEEHNNLPRDGENTVRNNGGVNNRCSGCCSARISRCVSLRCVLILAFSAALFLSALFWLPPFLGFSDPRDLDLDPRFKGII